MCSWSNKGNHLSNETCIALCSVNVGSALLLLLDKVSVCYRCCQRYQCVIAVELARYQCVIAVVKEFSVLSRLNWQGISVLSLLSMRSVCYRD